MMNIIALILGLTFLFGLFILWCYRKSNQNTSVASDDLRVRQSDVSLPGDIINSKIENNGTYIHHMSAAQGSVKIVSNKNGTRIRLGRGAKFSATINGKFLQLEGPKDKEWEEIRLE